MGLSYVNCHLALVTVYKHKHILYSVIESTYWIGDLIVIHGSWGNQWSHWVDSPRDNGPVTTLSNITLVDIKKTVALSTAVQSIGVQSTAVQSITVQSSAVQSTTVQSTAVQSPTALSTIVQSTTV